MIAAVLCVGPSELAEQAFPPAVADPVTGAAQATVIVLEAGLSDLDLGVSTGETARPWTAVAADMDRFNTQLRPACDYAALGRPLTGHINTGYLVVVSPDGHTLASGSTDQTVRLWCVTDPAYLTSLGHLTGHTNAVHAGAFSPDGHTLASGSLDRTVRPGALVRVGEERFEWTLTVRGRLAEPPTRSYVFDRAVRQSSSPPLAASDVALGSVRCREARFPGAGTSRWGHPVVVFRRHDQSPVGSDTAEHVDLHELRDRVAGFGLVHVPRAPLGDTHRNGLLSRGIRKNG
jgi:hypothetical protein